MKLSEIKGTKKAVEDYSPLGQLKKLPQPIGINGGAYVYFVDVTQSPLKFVASDGEVLDQAKTLEDIAQWMPKWSAKLWLDFLNDEENLEALQAEEILVQKQ